MLLALLSTPGALAVAVLLLHAPDARAQHMLTWIVPVGLVWLMLGVGLVARLGTWIDTALHEEAFMRGIFEATPDGILLLGPERRVVRANAHAERLFGYPPGGLEGIALASLLHDDPAHGVACTPLVERLRAAPVDTGMAGSVPLRGRRRDASEFPAEAMANALAGRDLLIVTVRAASAASQHEEALRQALADKNLLLGELYHRVKNNLQLIISLFDLQMRTVQSPRARRALAEAVGRVRAMALVHERLNGACPAGTIALHEYVGELCDQLAHAASARQRGIALALKLDPLDVGLDLALPLGLLLNEVMTNALKHAYPDERGGTIRVTLAPAHVTTAHAATHALTHALTVHDDGIGMPYEVIRTSTETLGLRLVAALSDQLHARLTLENRGGACITVAFRAPVGCVAPELAPASVAESAPTSRQQPG